MCRHSQLFSNIQIIDPAGIILLSSPGAGCKLDRYELSVGRGGHKTDEIYFRVVDRDGGWDLGRLECQWRETTGRERSGGNALNKPSLSLKYLL